MSKRPTVLGAKKRVYLSGEESLLRALLDDLSSSLPVTDDSLGELSNTLNGGRGLGGEVLSVGLTQCKRKIDK